MPSEPEDGLRVKYGAHHHLEFLRPQGLVQITRLPALWRAIL
jgi:hypothetical protein